MSYWVHDPVWPNKPMVPTARDCTEDRRSARDGSTSANRWADNERRQRATSDVRKSMNRANKRHMRIHQERKDRINAMAEKLYDVRCECGTSAVLKTGRDVYPHRPDLFELNFYVCPNDGYRVGCHKNTSTPLGIPTAPETQQARRAAHAAFDELWQRKIEKEGVSKSAARKAGYSWLASQLGIDAKDCHIGMMDKATAERVVTICAPYRRVKPRGS